MKKQYIFFAIILLLCYPIYSQTSKNSSDIFCKTILSSVDDSPIEGGIIKNISNKETTSSSKEGRFCIKAKKGDKLQISRLGYEAIVIELKDQLDSIVYLIPKQEQLKEIVITGNKNINDIDIRKLAGSIVTIDMKKLASHSEMDLLRLLQGQVPGLMVTSSGELGTKPTIRIRGESSFTTTGNEPLFVLDGVIISSDAFLALNPEDFDEIKILKDAAASALYGIKAANGVIEITSKKGFSGKPYVSFNSKIGITFKGPRGVRMMNSSEKLELERLIQNANTPGYRYSEDYYRKYHANDPNLNALITAGESYLDSLRNINTDWFDELIRMNIFQNYSLSIRGGSEKNTYFYSASYGKQGGRVEGNDIQRFTARMNQDYIISPQFNLSLNIGGGYSETNTPNGSAKDPTTLVYNLNPYEQKRDPKTGDYRTLWSYANQTFYDLTNEYSQKSTSKRVEASAIFHWNIFKNLDLSGVVGADYLLNEGLRIIPSTAFSEISYPANSKGELSQNKQTELNATSNFRINYNFQIDKHDITIGANTDYYVTDHDGIGLTGHGLPSKINTAAGINQGLSDYRRVNINSRKEKNAQFGFGAALGYSYNSIYDLYGSYKRDASSLLPSDKRWNTAWSLGIGWRFSNYSFMKDNSILTDIKLRASYGYTAGMSGISSESTVPTYLYGTDEYASGRSLSLKMLYNKDLRPQQTKNINLGVDFVFFKQLTLGVEVYKNRTEDAILSVPIPPSNGFTDMMRNIGVLDNKGFEVKILGDVISQENFTWNAAMSISWNKNTVAKLYDGDKLYLSEGSLFPDLEVGQPIGVLYGLRSIGIHPIDGLPRFLSATGEEIDYTHELIRDDFVKLGYSTPPYMGFFNNSLSYKSFTLSFDLYFSFGGIQKYNRNYVRDRSTIQFNAVKGQTQDMWFKPGDENKIYHTPNVPGSAYTILSHATTETVFKTDFMRLNNIMLTYRMPANWLADKTNLIKYLQFNIQGQNLFTIKKETDKASLVNVIQPVVTFGINATF